MKKSFCVKLVPILAYSTMAMMASAAPLAIGPTWSSQYQLMGASGENFSTNYVASQSEGVMISGFFENTDQYNVLVNGSLVLTTPAIAGPPVDYGDTLGTYTEASDAAFNSKFFSSGTFKVTAGDVILIQDIGPLFPTSNTAGGFDAQVGVRAISPEPSTLALGCLSASLAGIFAYRRKAYRRKSAA